MKPTFRTWLVTVAFASLVLQTSTSLAQAPDGTRKIEQDWRVELYVMPDSNRLTCPLFISSFSIPFVPALFQCTWNHRDIPILEEGGIQLQAYKWNNLLDDKEVITPVWRERLNTDNEVVTWTQSLRIHENDYIFKVKNIQGNTWGTIPGPYEVKRSFLFWAPPLEGYTYAEIADNSGIIMGGNRFKKLAITETRFYNNDGILLLEDTQEKVLFRFSSSLSYTDLEFMEPN